MKPASRSASVNEVIWIRSLYESECGLSNRIIEDLDLFFSGINCRFLQFEPKNADALLQYLDDLVIRAQQGAKPVLHLDTHGDAKDGLLIAASKEFIGWARIVDSFRQINVPASNNLIVISGACFSAHLLLDLDFFQPSPFFALYAPEKSINAGFLEDNLRRFYSELFGTASLDAALTHLNPDIALYSSQNLLFRLLVGYVKNFCLGKGGERRLEKLLTEAKEAVRGSGQPLSHWRAFAKRGIEPTAQLIYKAENEFLIGKSSGFTIDDVVKAAQESLFEDQRRLAENRRREKNQKKAARRTSRSRRDSGG
ncbi:hypothetical protein [Falsiroseomonas sp.]|uniref:hypothetical protein n=1 Tax=Falsiroseomonas sp. TaxID=2870721 RepID=UPI002732527B|nr:hypothetical protein [Falsiroseomonas sp.]MDP3414855.1 hypothetical protein [Falsiroseomonas sp.]